MRAYPPKEFFGGADMARKIKFLRCELSSERSFEMIKIHPLRFVKRSSGNNNYRSIGSKEVKIDGSGR